MPDQIFTVSIGEFFTVINVVIGLCYLSICAAFLYYLVKYKTTFRGSAFFAICVFFVLVGVSRLAKGMIVGPEDLPVKVMLDLFAALVGIPTAILVWPLLARVARLPSIAQLEETSRGLLHSQQLFEGFMRHSPSVQFVKDSQLRFRYVNEAFCRTFDVRRDNVLGQTNQSWMPPEIEKKSQESDLRVLEWLQPTEETFAFETPQGKRTWLMLKFPIWDDELMIGGIGVDITEKLAAEERAQHAAEVFRLMVTAVKDYAIFMMDPKGNIMTWNLGAERLKGYTADEVVGQHFSIFYPEEAKESNHPQNELNIAVKDGKYEEEGWRIKKDGSRFWAHVTITAVYNKDGSLSGFAKVTRDMTDRRRHEGELAIERDKALEASAMKSRFVANISHEIRTPLSGILGMNELLLQTDLDDEQREYAETVQESSESLLTVLNDVLDLSKVEAGKLELDQLPFNVSFATGDATRLMSAAAKNKGLSLSLRIDTSIPALVVGDPERFRQLLLNIIGNAVKFTQKGEISVSAQLLSEAPNTATIKFEVKDTGIGIAKEDRQVLFVPFAQIDGSSTRRFGGTGLGLTICKHLVERMDGEIGFESEKGKGSTFWFIIPFQKTAELPADAPAPRTGGGAPKRPIVLVVEDNQILQGLAARQLSNLGLDCQLATCGAAAIEAIQSKHFDLILMDIQLPQVDGYEATKAIRKIEQPKSIRTPIIAMTAKTLKGDKEKALAAGMDDYVTKPVSLDTLRYLCEKWLKIPIQVESIGKFDKSDQS